MMKQSVSQTQSNNNKNSADNFECIKEKGCGRELGRGRKGNCSGTRIKINKSGNDIKKTCGSIFFKLTPNPNASHSKHTIFPFYPPVSPSLPPPPPTTLSTLSQPRTQNVLPASGRCRTISLCRAHSVGSAVVQGMQSFSNMYRGPPSLHNPLPSPAQSAWPLPKCHSLICC